MKRLVHLTALLLTALQTYAQQPVYRHLTEDDGLPDNEIYYLYQDKKGIIWISTNSGLCRYNGQSVQYFSNPLLKAKSTSCIKEDSFGRIWVDNFSGQLFYVQNDSLVIVKLPGIENLNSFSPFTIGPGNELAVPSAENCIAIYKPLHTTATEKPGYVLDTVLRTANACPYYDSQGTLWATNGINGKKDGAVIAYKDQAVRSLYIQDPSSRTANNYVFEFNDKIYSFEREHNSLYVNDGKAFVLQRTLDIPGLKLVEPLHNGDLAFCTNSGLFISKEKDNTINELFEGQTISSFCEDNKGNLWVGTLTEGIYFIPRTGLAKIIPANSDVDYNNITALCAGPGNKIMLGFLNGELGCLSQNLTYQKLQAANSSSAKMQFVFYSPELQLLNWHNLEICQSSFSATDTKVVPHRGVGYASKDMHYIPQWNAALIANPVDISLISLDKKRITDKLSADWTKQYDTVTIFNFMQLPQQSMLLSKERGRAVYFDKATQALWGADKNGITIYKQNGKKNILLDNESVYATCFCEHNDIVWAGSFSQGVVGIKNEKAIKQFTIKDGLASNTVYKIIGSKDHLWIYTDKGLQYFDIPGEKFFLVDKTLGLPSYKINGMALVNEQLFISTPKGLLVVPDSVKFEGPENSTAYLQAVYCNEKIINQPDNTFNTNQNDFIFKIETPLYSNRVLLRYQYRLKGADKEMLTVGLDKAIFEYKSLQPGHYEFELQLTDAKGKRIGKPVSFLFSIDPPFYRTIWFVALCAVFSGLIIFYLVRKRIEQIKKRADEKLERAKLESDLKQSQLSGIKAQMNPHFMFNALNSIQEFILLNEKKQANMYMGKFADLMRMTLDMSNKKEVKLEEEIKILQLYLELESLRFEEQFFYTLTIDENVDKEHTYIPAMLIQPNIENAVKHGLLHKQGEKKLEVRFSIVANNTLCCIVTDNGIGRKRSGEINRQRLTRHTSFATGATQKRLELLNHDRKHPIEVTYQDLYDVHENASGTKVTICIPLA